MCWDRKAKRGVFGQKGVFAQQNFFADKRVSFHRGVGSLVYQMKTGIPHPVYCVVAEKKKRMQLGKMYRLVVGWGYGRTLWVVNAVLCRAVCGWGARVGRGFYRILYG